MLTNDELIRMAVQCHLLTASNRDGYYAKALLDFAKLVQQATLNTIHSLQEESSWTHK